MFWTEEKLAKRIAELDELRYRNVKPILEFTAIEDEEGNVGTRPPATAEGGTLKVGEYWAGRDRYVWLIRDVVIPEEWKNEEIVGIFDFGKTGGGNNSGFESLLYVNDKPYQGVDSNHKEVFFPGDFAGKEIRLAFRLWSGLEGGGEPTIQEHKIKQAALACLDLDTDDLYWTSKAIIETVKVFDENRPERQSLLMALDRAFLEIDWSKPGSERFYESVKVARNVLNEELDELEAKHPVTVHVIGHTHIDVAWLWRLKHTREKAARSFSTVLRLMEKYPDYIFLQTQPQLYEYIKNDYPEIYEQIKERVKEGRWEAEGGMWLESDCNIPSGESLVRQLLFGTRFLKQEFGVRSKYLWLPDVFGYNWALPQILKKSGIDTFMTTKISWSQYNRMPHDTFFWKGIDGTEILTHFITTPTSEDIWYYTYNGEITPKTVTGIWESYRDKEINRDLLLSYGYGDGGGGVNREMLEMRRRLDKLPGIPNVVPARAGEYFEKLHQNIEQTDRYIHTWDGELYLEYHRGTYTSQARTKRWNRKLELLLRETEWLSSLTSVLAGDFSIYPQQAINDSWKIVLRNQFHDIIPGSSIKEVYEDSEIEYSEAHDLAKGSWEQLSTALVEEENNTFTIFNSSTWQRDDIVEITAPEGTMENGVWVDAEGNLLDAQKTEAGWLVKVRDLPALGYTTIQYKEAETGNDAETPFVINDNSVETPYYRITWNESGQLESIFDKEAHREVLAVGERGNVFQLFEDKPLNFENWDIDIFYQEKMKEIRDLQGVKVLENGPLSAKIEFTWKYENSVITQEMVVYRNNRRIDFRTHVDWHEQQQLLKVAFPVNIRATEATYDIQFGNVKRPTHWNTSWDMAKFETVGHQWVDLSERNYGVSLLNDCKYGHDIKDHTIRLTLIKCGKYPDTMADQGEHIFTYSLLPHEGDWVEANTVQEAWKLNNPLTYAQGKAKEHAALSLFKVSTDHIMIDAVKKAEDSDKLVLRLHEFTGARAPVTITSDFEIASWQECNLIEEPEGPVHETNKIKFDINPYEIKTFLVELKNKQ